MTSPAVPGENQALSQALMRYKAQENEEGGLAALIEFVGCFPNSRWRASLELNLGLIIFDKGYLSEAGKHWEEAWTLSKNEKVPGSKACCGSSCL